MKRCFIVLSLVCALLALSLYFRLDLAVSDPYLWHVHLGKKHLDVVRPESARSEFMKAAAIDPSRMEAHKGLYKVYAHYGSRRLMEQEIRYFEDNYPYSRFYLNIQGWDLFESGNYSGSLTYFFEGLKTLPSEKSQRVEYLYLWIGQALIGMGNHSGAITYLEKGFVMTEELPQQEPIKPCLEKRFLSLLEFSYKELGNSEKAKEARMRLGSVDKRKARCPLPSLISTQ